MGNLQEIQINTDNKHITLYHGSKSGIKGTISPLNRDKCDFRFYMETEKEQPLTLVCNFPDARFYRVDLNLEGLKILNIDVGIDWALLIAYNRGKMESIKDSKLYRNYQIISKNYDIVTGFIANDRMFVVLDRFFSGEITDSALVHSLAALQ